MADSEPRQMQSFLAGCDLKSCTCHAVGVLPVRQIRKAGREQTDEPRIVRIGGHKTPIGFCCSSHCSQVWRARIEVRAADISSDVAIRSTNNQNCIGEHGDFAEGMPVTPAHQVRIRLRSCPAWASLVHHGTESPVQDLSIGIPFASAGMRSRLGRSPGRQKPDRDIRRFAKCAGRVWLNMR